MQTWIGSWKVSRKTRGSLMLIPLRASPQKNLKLPKLQNSKLKYDTVSNKAMASITPCLRFSLGCTQMQPMFLRTTKLDDRSNTVVCT